MKRIREIYIITLIIIIIGVSTSFATAGTVNTNGVRMRATASTDGEIITNLHNGDKVEIIEKVGTWYKITYNGQEGYVHSDYVRADGEIKTAVEETPTEEEQTTPGEVAETPVEKPEENKVEETYPKTVTLLSNVNVYVVPSITSTITMEIALGQQITVNSKIGSWLCIAYEGTTGWIRSSTLEAAVETNPVQKGNTETEQKPETNNNTEPVQTTTKKYVNVTSANVRQEPNTSSTVVTALTKDAAVTVIGEEGEWYKVQYGDYTGYISKPLLSDNISGTVTSRSDAEGRQEEVVTPITKTGYVSVSIANVRQEPSTNSSIVTTLKQKAEVKIYLEESGFYKIEANGIEGYISKGLIVDSLDQIVVEEPAKTTTEKANTTKKSNSNTTSTQISTEVASTGSSEGTDVVAFAKKYVGYKYVYGGTTPSGFDCSGFVYYVYNSCGYNLSRLCSVQAKSGTAVSKANLQPGDLVFFNNGSGGSIGHVGIYIGGGKFIHAATPSKGVRIDTLNSGYYNTYYYSARRVI